jgi:hypothetical protein
MNYQITLILFYTCGLSIVVSHVMVPLPYRFPLGFLHRYDNLTILCKVLFQIGEGYPAIHRGERASCSRGGGQSDDS